MKAMKYYSDSSKDVWDNFYKIYYKNTEDVWDFWAYVDFDDLKGKEEDQYASVAYKGIKGEVHGEVDFNFKSDKNPKAWQKRKYDYYENILQNDDKMSSGDKQDAISMLMECRDRMYEPNNLSLLFRTGGLNNLKGGLSQETRALDRFDVFIYVLNDYLSTVKEKRSYMHLIFSQAWKNSADNRACLKEYLNQFDNIEEYFEKVLLIKKTNKSKDFIKRLIISGTKPINDGKRVIEYLKFAKEYWDLKQEQINSVFKRESSK